VDCPVNLLHQLSCSSTPAAPGNSTFGNLLECLNQRGFTLWTNYQPASRFWPFQWIESGWLLALSALLIGAAVWLVRRRAT
jgi:hypothetical protein